jgi:hypothetical protein
VSVGEADVVAPTIANVGRRAMRQARKWAAIKARRRQQLSSKIFETAAKKNVGSSVRFISTNSS